MRETLGKCRNPTREIVKQIVQAENGYMNIKHPQFSKIPLTKEEKFDMLPLDHPERKLVEATEEEKQDYLNIGINM